MLHEPLETLLQVPLDPGGEVVAPIAGHTLAIMGIGLLIARASTAGETGEAVGLDHVGQRVTIDVELDELEHPREDVEWVGDQALHPQVHDLRIAEVPPRDASEVPDLTLRPVDVQENPVLLRKLGQTLAMLVEIQMLGVRCPLSLMV